ncbi:CRISPR-associated endonuclease Cas1 [Tuanshanicoccus lijuaniae]|uniref:CRISPR-associated endonuclease Cas1 n=1 Tax=Aerococcaceae bacterium zg-1292 TaxID=2774330 RepID=UPI0019378665|nr:CRISPR-associated endonuclease Cas1 [Aerococcaceae bacterium zg-1292]MBS4456716.1 CRISPR-associated endonuclease Cas1 [Aerococcaceae bacterium zg-A91]MBS4458508.1 CRISPR-associated endonuclease Cas1 [Aerococcaceae bacterium zg-BR33]QQA36566.1 CRISPR-associated endonuclease Cas1 [Aerococcaceae bacterium zg-1292]
MNELIVNDSNCKLSLRQDNVLVKSKNDVILQCLALSKIDAVSIYGSPSISTQLVKKLAESKIGLYYYTFNGAFIAETSTYKFQNYTDQLLQVKALADERYRLNLAKRIVKNKIQTQIELLAAYNTDQLVFDEDFSKMKDSLTKVDEVTSTNQLLGIEGRVAKSYFYFLGLLVPTDFKFYGRSKRPAKDAFNVLLNIGYHILYRHTVGAIIKYGINPGFGIVHQVHAKHFALASDLMEPWRAIIVDDIVMRCIKESIITIDMFSKEEDGSIRLSNEGVRAFREQLRLRMLEQHHYITSDKKFFTCSHVLHLQVESLKRSFKDINPELFVIIGEDNEKMV